MRWAERLSCLFIFFVSVSFITTLFVKAPIAEKGCPQSKIVAACYKMRGTVLLSADVGPVFSRADKVSLSALTAGMPKEVADAIFSDTGAFVVGDFELCPFANYYNPQMEIDFQVVCLRSVENQKNVEDHSEWCRLVTCDESEKEHLK